MATFEDAWRDVRLHVAMADPFLCRKWVQQSYKDIADRYPWSFLYEEVVLTTDASSARTASTRSASTTSSGRSGSGKKR